MTSSALEPVVRNHDRDDSDHYNDHYGQALGSLPDIAGVAILASCALWALICAMGRTARPEGVLLAVLAVAAGYACGRIAGSLLPVACGAAAGLAGLGLTLAGWSGPGGHQGLEAAQLTLATGAACCAAWAARRTALRLALWLLAVTITLTAVVSGPPAGWAASGAVLLYSLAAARLRRRLAGLAALALVAAVGVGGCWAVAADAVPGGLPRPLRSHLTEHRIRMWQDAAHLAAANPVRGAGPDRFAELSPAAAQSPEPDTTPHSAPLQQAAGQGLPGVALLGAAFAWLLYALWRSPRSTPVVLTAAAALTALAVEASLGNALSFPQVTAGAGLLAGLATARHPEEPPPRTTP
ncbi:O-antigen ligase family protein [Streptomyces sp. RTd22]|uniref:O-antigen ligase family protein n=1 Tax=Streptomyces sp. RTd22 TaxID=1841249 RepID=UPI000A92EC48|nr:O-antigen ligase family protein [Streptomyces sp. RTd22]